VLAFAPFIPLGWIIDEGAQMLETLLKSFDKPDEVREFPFGRFEIIYLDGVSLGRATYQPVKAAGTTLCHAPHTGTVLSGHGAVQYENGEFLDLFPGTVFYITTTPHDSWVVGNVPYVSLHVLKPHVH
jgi:hypothetical protein